MAWLPSVVSLREKLHRLWNGARARFLPEPYRTVLPYTRVGLTRLRCLDRLTRLLDERAVPGDVVECGTCNGGSGAVLARVACRSPLGRHTWLLDSFAGLPTPGPQDGPAASAFTGMCRSTRDNVRAVLGKVGVPESAFTLVPGWFHETLPTLAVPRIALLHIDADWYDSVRLCLEHLYDRVQPGGFVVFDDLGYWQGCRQAWEELRSERRLDVQLTDVDGIGAYFEKPADPPAPASLSHDESLSSPRA
jgi:O-methyltransferase